MKRAAVPSILVVVVLLALGVTGEAQHPKKVPRMLKEAVPKVARVAVLYDPANPPNVREVKEVLPVAARALGLTIQPWEVRAADGFEKVFAALNKERPDGLYVSAGPANGC